MLRSFLIIVTCLSALSVMGQTKLTSEQEKQVLAKMEKSSNALRTLQCDFVQSKRMKLLSKEMQSKGVLYFVKPDKIRWQYTAPYDYTFIMNGDKVQIKSAKKTKNIDIQGNKIFRQITTIILNTVTGGGIMNSADFDVELFKLHTRTVCRRAVIRNRLHFLHFLHFLRTHHSRGAKKHNYQK